MEKTESFSIQDVARKQIETTKKVYLLSPERMFSEFNGEQENVKNYNGRQLLEMLQNADDAASEASGERKVLIKLFESKLIIANTGYPFSEEGLNSVFHSHLSPKEAKQNQIGKKGLGFRSILSWAVKVSIKSRGLNVSFSKEYSHKVLEELLQDKDFNITFKKLNKNHTSPISTLICPNIECDDIIAFDSIDSYDTIIQIDLNDNAIEEVKKQVQQDLDAEVLLFLNNLQHIEIDLDGEIIEYKKESISDQSLKIISIHSGTNRTDIWNINSISGHFEDIDKPYQLSIAWQNDFQNYKEVIYAYFRTKVPFKSKGILHGSFELNADRNLIINDSTTDNYNIRLVKLLPELISQVAESIANNEGDNVNYNPINFLDIDFNPLNHLIDVDAIKDNLLDFIKPKKIFPTIANQYINWNDNDKPVYYPEEEFANFLNPNEFPDLLLCCDNETDEHLIIQLNPNTYNIEAIIESVTQNSLQLSTEDYAKLVYAIYNYIDNVSDIKTISLLYDENKSLLKFNNQIFLPNNDEKFNLPSGLGVQIINTELADNLIEITQSNNYNGLSRSLYKYKLKEYNFFEIAETLINHFNNNSSSSENIIELNQHLFKLYLLPNNPLAKWTGSQVLSINKKGSKCFAHELYFGKEYQNVLTEEIYNYNKGKIIAGPKKFKIDYTNEIEWKKYLIWLGVEYLPRKIKIKSNKDYAIHVMRNYNYKDNVDGYFFKNGFKQFQENLNSYGLIEVTTIDDLENILINNSSEKIIELIDTDESLQKTLEKDKEEKTSTISFWFYYAKQIRTIYGDKMKSYLRWKIENSAWLNTEGEVKSQPSRCSTAAYINEDFRGMIDKPKLDIELLRRNNINRDKIDFLLSIVGVHKSINTFTTSMLYSILLKLPEIDKEGKKAKTIYNQLAVNFDDRQVKELDKLDRFYIKFHQAGKVYCKSGAYFDVKDVYYVNDKRYGESVIKQFEVIEIDRRRGKEKIKNIFGVRALDNIELSLDGDPSFHIINPSFEQELEIFKPYVYVLRKEVDSGSEKNTIKDTRFKLVNKLRVKLKKDEKYFVFELNSYEYFYLKSKNIVYLIAPIISDNIQQLKDDIHFCSTIAETFSAILDVDAQRQQIRELFSKNSFGRDELLRSEIEDDNLEKLNEAKKMLGIISNPKIDFWKAFAKCFKGKSLKIKDETENGLLNSLLDAFPKFEIFIKDVFENVNFQDLNEVDSSELIIKLFKESGITINKFNQHHYPTIDISQLYEINFNRSTQKYFNKFKILYYNKCLLNYELQSKFLDVINAYNYLIRDFKNEVDFDTDADLSTEIMTLYSIDLEEDIDEINWNEIYTNNLNLLQENITGLTIDNSLLNQYLKEDITSQSLIYFRNQIPVIKTRIQEWLGKNNSEDASSGIAKKSKRILFGDNTILYDDLIDLKNQIDIIIQSQGIDNISSKNIKISKLDSIKNNSNSGGGSKINSRKPKVPKEEIGFLGEYLVYKYLLENTEIKDSVKWVSEYAKDCGVNLDGKDGLGYDIEYIPNGAKHQRYVEVKVLGWDDAFHISSNEVKCGEMLKKYYEIFLVRNLETPTSVKIEKIQGLFDYKGKSFTDNDLFSVINDNFIIRFKKQE